MLRKRPSSRVHTFLARWGADARAAAYAPNGAGAKRARTSVLTQSGLRTDGGGAYRMVPHFSLPPKKARPPRGPAAPTIDGVSKMPARTKNDADGGLGTW